MKPWGRVQRKKLNIALLLLLIAALLALAGVLLLRARPDAVSPDNRIETAKTLSLPVSRTAIFRALNGQGDATPARLDMEVSLPGAQEAMGMAGMMPGDSVEKTYTVAVRSSGPAVLHFGASLRDDEAHTLAQGLHITVYQGETLLYDSTVYALSASEQSAATLTVSASVQLPYTIRVSLPTSAGNEYQGKSLTVDLKWWLTDSGGSGGGSGGGSSGDFGGGSGGGSITVTPTTGDDFPLTLAFGAAALSLALLVVLCSRRRARHD